MDILSSPMMPASQPGDRRFRFLPLLFNLVITLGIGFSASLFTRPEIPGWYRALNKPGFTPPDWLFAPVWTLLYIMMGVAFYQIWKRRDDGAAYGCAKASYVLQLILNFLWSLTFFRLHQTGLALTVILCLAGSIMGTIFYFSKIYRPAAWLIVPYLLWVAYATALNLAIVLLNT